MSSTPRASSPCRVAVVDDDPFELEEMVSSLQTATEEYRLGEVTVEAFSDASEVARRIAAAGASPPWEVILSDVLMPEVDSGGFLIARAIKERYAGQEVPLKLALVTRRAGYVSARRPFREFSVAETADWFWFFVKEENGVASGEPLLPASVWKRALAQMIRLRDTERWGFRPLRSMDDVGATRETFRSVAATTLLTAVENLGENAKIRAVVLEAEAGSDLLPLAVRLLHFHRAQTAESAGLFSITCEPGNEGSRTALFGSTLRSAAAVDRPGRLEMAAGGTLFVDRADALPEADREALVRAVATRRFSRLGETTLRPLEVDLLVLGVSAPNGGRGGEPLWSLRSRTDTAWIRIPPLTERPEDIVSVAVALLEDLARDDVPVLTDDATAWLRESVPARPERLDSLVELMKIGSDYGSKAVVTRRDLAAAAVMLGWAESASAPAQDPGDEAWKDIRLLLVLVNPRNLEPLRVDEELRRVREAVRRAKYRERFTRIEVTTAVTDRDLQRALLDDDWTIVHFGGHGCRQGLLLEDDAGEARRLPMGALTRMLEQQRDSLRCVLLNACSTKRQGQMIAREVPVVIASRAKLSDAAAVLFAEAFYDALAAGKPANYALSTGTIALEAASIRKHQWPERVRWDAGDAG